jgi:ribosomal protein L11 methylase PrmA
VTFEVADLAAHLLTFGEGLKPAPGVIVANLTGALLIRSAPLLVRSVRPGGHIVASGLMNDEQTPVVSAFSPARLVFEAHEDGWAGLIFNLG